MSDFNIQFEEQDQSITLEFEQIGGGAVKSVNGKTGAVVLDAGNLEYDDTETYSSGSVGGELSTLKDGLPFIDVNSMALMTDVTKLYRYDGSLYFYNGSEWAEVGTGASGDGIILVSLASDMTDTSSVYLYNGTETGYVSGHWYYYDTGTSAWTDGGNYTGWGTIESVLAGMTIEIQTKEIGVLTLTFGDEEYIYDGSSDVSIILADADTTSY